MDEGLVVDAFDDLFGHWEPTVESTLRLFLALLAARSIAVPDRRSAIGRLVVRHVRRIASPDHDARVELQAPIDAVYREPELRDATVRNAGDAGGREQLVRNHWSFDDLEHDRDISVAGHFGAAAIDRMMRQTRLEAERWLRRRAR